MIVYTPGTIQDLSQFISMGSPEELGRITLHFPFIEHATILEGEVDPHRRPAGVPGVARQ